MRVENKTVSGQKSPEQYDAEAGKVTQALRDLAARSEKFKAISISNGWFTYEDIMRESGYGQSTVIFHLNHLVNLGKVERRESKLERGGGRRKLFRIRSHG